MKKNILFAFILGVITMLMSFNAYCASVEVNGEKVETESVILNGRTLVPVRGVFEKLGFDVEWDAHYKKAIFDNGQQQIEIRAGLSYFNAGDKIITPDVPQQIISDRLYIPLRAVAEATGAEVDWKADEKCAVIKTNDEGSDLSDMPFEYQLYSQMPDDKNFMISPLSIKMALALASNGAEGETARQIENALNIDNIDVFNAKSETMIAQYNKKDDIAVAGGPIVVEDNMPEFTFNIANSIWANEDSMPGIDFSDSYKAVTNKYYDAEANVVNNSNAVEKINSWVNEKTNNKIDSIISSPDFLACLVNAVYFNANWAFEFYEGATRPADFTDRNGQVTQIDFMNQTEEFNYYKDNDVEMVELPYMGSDVSMYIVLSDDKRLDYTEYFDKLNRRRVQLSIPKFETKFESEISSVLNKMGIVEAFGNAADFSEMFNESVIENVKLSKVLHKTFIRVDEKGTEAAAVTAIMLDGAAIMEPEEPVIFKANKPFTYIIRDNGNDEILFMGEFAFAE